MNAPIDVTNIVIQTPRLRLRPWKASDLQDFYEYASVDGVGQMAGWLPHTSLDVSRQILDCFIAEKKVLALELRENGKVIGSLGFEERTETSEIHSSLMGRELGYVLSKDYWGQGLMPEAVQAVITYSFEKLNYDYLLCAHFVRNPQSRRVVEKCGFQYLKDFLHTTRYGTQEQAKLYVRYKEVNDV